VRQTLKAAGVEFIDENGGGAGVNCGSRDVVQRQKITRRVTSPRPRTIDMRDDSRFPRHWLCRVSAQEPKRARGHLIVYSDPI
jgi:hypothetical protein